MRWINFIPNNGIYPCRILPQSGTYKVPLVGHARALRGFLRSRLSRLPRLTHGPTLYEQGSLEGQIAMWIPTHMGHIFCKAPQNQAGWGSLDKESKHRSRTNIYPRYDKLLALLEWVLQESKHYAEMQLFSSSIVINSIVKYLVWWFLSWKLFTFKFV